MNTVEQQEEFRPIPGFEDSYRIGNKGTVVSVEREIQAANRHGPFTKRIRSRILRPSNDRDGYPHVVLYREGVRTGIVLHRVVWMAFNGPIADGLCVCHKDDNPGNPALDNLFLGTPAENAADRNEKGRQAIGNRHGRTRIRDEDVAEVLRLRHEGVPQIEVARMFGVTDSAIYMIETGRNRKHLKATTQQAATQQQ